jgi:2'-5' RNA ligase
MPEPIRSAHYAVVAYVRNQVGHFVEELRRELHPDHAHLAAHVTVLPPRQLSGSEQEAIQSLQERSARFPSFDVQLGDVETFCPRTPTVFVRVERFGHRFRDLHDELNSGPLHCHEQWPYMPHLTIVKMPELSGAEHALITSRERWANYSGNKSAHIEELTFVREGENSQWIDLATVRLGQFNSMKPGNTPTQSTPTR